MWLVHRAGPHLELRSHRWNLFVPQNQQLTLSPNSNRPCEVYLRRSPVVQDGAQIRLSEYASSRQSKNPSCRRLRTFLPMKSTFESGALRPLFIEYPLFNDNLE